MKIDLMRLNFKASRTKKSIKRFVTLLTEENYKKLNQFAEYYDCTRNGFLNDLLEQIEIPESEEANNQSTDK